MIKEIAIDPELFCRWEHYLALRHEFAVEKGRLISGFPKKWKKLVREASEVMEREGTLASGKAENIRNWLAASPGTEDPRFMASACAYNWEKEWHLNAEDHATHFCAVLSHRNIDVPNALLADEDRTYLLDHRFAGMPQMTVGRNKKALVDCVWPLVRVSKRLRIVEPNFNPNRQRFLATLEELLDRLHSGGSSIREIELHVRNPDDCKRDETPSFTRSELKHKVLPLLRTGYRITTFLWSTGREKLHPRYLLTDRGGVKIDWGWDEGELPSETTAVDLLSAVRWEQEWNRYCLGNPDFDIDPDQNVVIIE